MKVRKLRAILLWDRKRLDVAKVRSFLPIVRSIMLGSWLVGASKRETLAAVTLHNPSLENVDPFDPNLGPETKAAILQECKVNPQYFFQVCVRVPDKSGSPPKPSAPVAATLTPEKQT